jgi:hypothetical protein
MNRPESPTPAALPSTKRRKLIRAGFAVPVIATVASGSALAASSASCMARQTASTDTGFYPAVNLGTGDTYMRVQLGLRTIGGNSSKYYVDGNKLNNLLAMHSPTLEKSSGYMMSANKFQEFSVLGNEEVGSIIDALPNGQGGSYTDSSGQFAVLRFGSDGRIVGVGSAPGGGQSAVQLSCWSSLTPRPL